MTNSENNISSQNESLPGTPTELFEKNEIIKVHQFFEREFNTYFEECGYQKHKEAPLISQEDNSVIYTGASISAIKQLLLSGDYPKDKNGVYINQECLRTQALKQVFDNEYIPFGQTYFHMSTIHSKPGRFKEVTMEALNFTVNRLGIDPSRILLRSTKQKGELNEIDSYAGVKVDYDTMDNTYYSWKYGIPKIYGDGVGVCILNSADNKYWDVGNIVRILNEDNNELGTEFGYGHEFFLSAMIGVRDPLRLSQVFELFGPKEGLSKKFYSYLEATTRMKIAGAEIGDKKEEHIYKQYLKAVQYIGQVIGKNVGEVIEEMQYFHNFIYKDAIDFNNEKNFMLKHYERKKNFKEMVTRVGKYLWATENHNNPKEYIADPKEMIENYLVQNGINKLEVSKELERLRRFRIPI